MITWAVGRKFCPDRWFIRKPSLCSCTPPLTGGVYTAETRLGSFPQGGYLQRLQRLQRLGYSVVLGSSIKWLPPARFSMRRTSLPDSSKPRMLSRARLSPTWPVAIIQRISSPAGID